MRIWAHLCALHGNLTFTECRRLIGCLKSHVIFRKRATNYRVLLRKMTYKHKASYDSTPAWMCPSWSHCCEMYVPFIISLVWVSFTRICMCPSSSHLCECPVCALHNRTCMCPSRASEHLQCVAREHLCATHSCPAAFHKFMSCCHIHERLAWGECGHRGSGDKHIHERLHSCATHSSAAEH